MAFPFYENSLNLVGSLDTHEQYQELMQAFIDNEWENTSAKTPENGGEVLEQTDIGSTEYEKIEVWINPVVGDTSTGLKQSLDFQKFLFRNVEHRTTIGLMYQFIGNYWITYNDNPYDGIPKAILVRRCNNVLRIADKDKGGIFEIPCVVEYDMSAPSDQVTRYIITPNNHAIVDVQGNADTLRLFKYNTRYVLNGRVFKLLAWQNALNNANTNTPTLLRLDLYLDETHAGDDIENGLAYNGDFDYSVKINANDMEVAEGDTGTLTAMVLLNGEEDMSKSVSWSSSDDKAISINANGSYEVLEQHDKPVVITASMPDNENISDSITLTIVDTPSATTPVLIFTPFISKIRQFESITISVGLEYGGNELPITNLAISCSCGDKIAVTKTSNNSFDISSIGISSTPVDITVTATNNEYGITATQTMSIKAVSMLG